MDKALQESKKLAFASLNEKQLKKLQLALNQIYQCPDNYDIKVLWELDRSIGLIGGYCMPADPKNNPFPGGFGRDIFRPLQYARAEIEISNIFNTARYVVQYSGMHLKGIARYVLGCEKFLGVPRYNNATLGKAISLLNNAKLYDEKTINCLYMFIPIFNKAKHDVNQDEQRERLLLPPDAVIAYISSRVLGNKLLKPYYNEIILKLNDYIGRLDSPNMLI